MPQLQERTLLFKGKTTGTDDGLVIDTTKILTGDIDAPWEIQVRAALGPTATVVAGTGGDSGIDETDAQKMGNLIHRLLKEYMTGYSNAKIQNVRLNVTLKE